MSRVVPFRGLLYSPARTPDLKPVVAPPYDVISAEKAEELRARHPYNVVHLDLPQGESAGRYATASALLSRWIEEGVLARDESPGFYVCSQRYAVRGMPERTRWGLLGLVGIEDGPAVMVLPHEHTTERPRTDRMELMAATRAQTSPIFMMYADPAGGFASLVEAAGARQPDRWAADDAGVDVRLWRLGDPDVVRALCEGFEQRRIYIADGHHRYEAARRVRDRWRAEGPRAESGVRSYDYVLAYLSSLDAPGMTILPYHRVLKGFKGFEAAALARRAAAHFDVKRFSFDGYDHRAEQIRRRLHEFADRGRLALGCYAGGNEYLMLVLRPGGEDRPPFDRLPAPLRALDAAILHHGVFEDALGLSPESWPEEVAVHYTEDVERALGWVDAADGQAAFLLNPARSQQVMAVADAGLQMPAKSTYFYPKVMTGLVIYPLDPFEEVFEAPGRAAVSPAEG